jgi:hypothetical protein
MTSRSGSCPGNRLRQKPSSHAGLSCLRIPSTAAGVATIFAPGKRSSTGATPKKWSPWPCVTKIVARFFPVAAIQLARSSPSAAVISGSTRTASRSP